MPSCLLCPVRIPFVPFFLCRVKENRLVGFFGCLFQLLSVGGLSSAAAGGLRLSSSIAVDSVSVEDSIHEE